MNLLVATVVAFVATAYGASYPVPNSMFPALQATGIPVLEKAIKDDNDAFNAALEAFKPVNETCNTIVAKEIKKCEDCIGEKCENRGKDVCTNDFEKFLIGTKDFFEGDVPDFFSQTLPNVIVDDIGGTFVNLGNEVGDFTVDVVGKGLVGVGTDIGTGFVDLGKDIGNVATSIGNGVVGIGTDIGNGIVDVGGSVISGIGSGFGSIGRGIGGIFGRRRRSVAAGRLFRRESEPSCDDIKKDASKACMYYLPKCSQCKIEKTKVCPGYKKAMEDLLKANEDRQWMAKLTKNNYNIISIMYDPMAFDPSTAKYKNTAVSVNLFGSDLSFNLDINPFDAANAGVAIANKALNELKSS